MTLETDYAMVGAVSDDLQELKRWRRVISRARRSLNRGAMLVTPSGIRVPVETHRYSDGAASLYKSGIQLAAFAGKNRYEVEVVLR